MMCNADAAMYVAKRRGPGLVEIFDEDASHRSLDRLDLGSDLAFALDRGELTVYYQPIFDIASGTILRLEALARWHHPRRGMVPPSVFIPLAEESGTIVPLGEWAIRAACAQLYAWRGAGALSDVTMSVNVSGRQFRRPEVVETLQRIARQEAVDPRRLAVEITESVIMDDVGASAAKLAQLRDLGIQIHVDDFGTGYSSLSYLHRFPITAVKIDRSFVAGLPTHAESEEVIKAIVSIAESLGFDVIAEGVEGEGHAARLQALRCRLAQGFHLSRPMDAEALRTWAAGLPWPADVAAPATAEASA
jgi:EAL domain-containing protein (putative c-di-GMP-specific phosphodiesterase class I)